MRKSCIFTCIQPQQRFRLLKVSIIHLFRKRKDYLSQWQMWKYFITISRAAFRYCLKDFLTCSALTIKRINITPKSKNYIISALLPLKALHSIEIIIFQNITYRNDFTFLTSTIIILTLNYSILVSNSQNNSICSGITNFNTSL